MGEQVSEVKNLTVEQTTQSCNIIFGEEQPMLLSLLFPFVEQYAV
jgi:hypothetical protein